MCHFCVFSHTVGECNNHVHYIACFSEYNIRSLLYRYDAFNGCDMLFPYNFGIPDVEQEDVVLYKPRSL